MEIVNEKLFFYKIFEPTLNLTLIECIDWEIIKADSMHKKENEKLQWLSILTEEVGEVATALNELRINKGKEDSYLNENKKTHFKNKIFRKGLDEFKNRDKAIMDNLRYELIQVTATAIRFLRNINNKEKIKERKTK